MKSDNNERVIMKKDSNDKEWQINIFLIINNKHINKIKNILIKNFQFSIYIKFSRHTIYIFIIINNNNNKNYNCYILK